MASGRNIGSDRERRLDTEIKRYQEAAGFALGQLEWIVGYLHKIRSPKSPGRSTASESRSSRTSAHADSAHRRARAVQGEAGPPLAGPFRRP
jgi:hypothetical protein